MEVLRSNLWKPHPQEAHEPIQNTNPMSKLKKAKMVRKKGPSIKTENRNSRKEEVFGEKPMFALSVGFLKIMAFQLART